MRDGAIILIATVAIILSLWSFLYVKHIPTHAQDSARLYNLERWVRMRCINEPIKNACAELQSIDQVRDSVKLYGE